MFLGSELYAYRQSRFENEAIRTVTFVANIETETYHCTLLQSEGVCRYMAGRIKLITSNTIDSSIEEYMSSHYENGNEGSY